MKIQFLILLLLHVGVASAQEDRQKRPKLMIGIVVDQMRQEYLYRYYDKFGSGGFKRLLNEGFECKNAHYNYAPTVTGPGHASVYTGTTPSVHGIISNDWYDKDLKQIVNCVNDPTHTPVGNPSGNGDVSPWRLLSTTVTDELKLATQKRSKVIGVSIKDRGAVLPAGHLPDGAYWYDSETGKFITSTYYKSKLPQWVETFNQQNLADKYLSQVWNTYYPIEQYTESGPDDTPYEVRLKGKKRPVFPYDLKSLRKSNGNFDLLINTPFANDYLTLMAKAAVEGEELGKDDVTDFLTISFSTTDILGHAVGPNSVEIQDTYIRLDKNIEELLAFLDSRVGEGSYTLFVTSDHGVAEVAQYLRDNKIPAGYFNPGNAVAHLEDLLSKNISANNLIERIYYDQLYFNHQEFQSNPRASGIEMIIASELVHNYLLGLEGVANVYTESTLRQGNYNEGGVKGMVIRGYHPKRSGDMVIMLEPGWYTAGQVEGTTHGSPYTYDTHIPMIFYGQGVKKGSSTQYHPITDIAPTISVILKIRFPNGCTGNPVSELLD